MSAFSFDEYKKQMNTYVPNGDQKFDKNTSIDAIYWKMLYSSTAMNNKIANLPDNSTIETNLKRLAKLLYYMVSVLDIPLNINSGYRNNATNKAVGSSSKSQHGKGQAVDLRTQSSTPIDTAKIFMFAVNNSEFKNKFDQIIWETNTYGSYWTHISFVINGDDISNDSSYSPRSKTDNTKMLWYTSRSGLDTLWDKNSSKASASRYINLRNGCFLNESNGTISFKGVSYLQDIKYDNDEFVLDSSSSYNLDNYSTESTIDYSSVISKYTSSNTKGSGQTNKVSKLSNANTKYTDSKGISSDDRKKKFSSLAEEMKNNSITASNRDVVLSPEQYDVNILKGDQTSKDMVGLK